ncbi:nucleic acid-binding protein [Candidatus Synechococcus calcipolaris G9]|uniref:Nucleic acid-binding protein n=1 Tax=Candidatus Synechococcus calcipolaris G9 TaxID=1497997 RepID=A0ABT6EZF1_9SYNE|nr:nucleic acid-binding protein [Candidatus Synechococcus calcipolaris]MDG2990978.1 nucleic acid-binding protein [Candidatus Synechococcus calcipolaris G9]
MSEISTKSELGQVLDAIASMQSDMKSMQGDIKSMQGDIQALTIEVKVSQAKIDGLDEKLSTQIKGVDEKLGAQIKAMDDKVDDLRARQTGTDARLWSFVIALVLALIGLLAKVSLFDKV